MRITIRDIKEKRKSYDESQFEQNPDTGLELKHHLFRGTPLGDIFMRDFILVPLC